MHASAQPLGHKHGANAEAFLVHWLDLTILTRLLHSKATCAVRAKLIRVANMLVLSYLLDASLLTMPDFSFFILPSVSAQRLTALTSYCCYP